MLSDAEIRGLVLATLHNLHDRNGGVVPLSDINFSPHPITPQKIDAVCQHLADLELIQWIPTPAGTETAIAGKGKIMGKGAAAFENGRCDEINIRFPSSNATAADLPAMSVAQSVRPSAPASEQPMPQLATKQQAEMVTLKPSIWGMSIDLKEAVRRARSQWQRWRGAQR